MAIKIERMTNAGIIGAVNGKAFLQKVDILADNEAEITTLGVIVTDMYGVTVRPAAGSMAHTAGYGAIYELSPSGLWTKM